MRPFIKHNQRFFPNGTKSAEFIPVGDYLMVLQTSTIHKVTKQDTRMRWTMTHNLEHDNPHDFVEAFTMCLHLKSY
jgi:hypothetical protein